MDLLNTTADEELLPELISGSADAFTVLYDRYHKSIYQFIYKYVHSGALADDLTQEVFIKIWNGRHQLNNIQSFKGYLFVSARNHTLNSLKAALRSDKTMGEIVKNFVAQRKATDERLLEADYAAFLQRELSKLPERSREIFRLCRQEYRTYEEVAQQLGISKSAVKSHMVSSMKVLKTSVEQELGVSLATVLAVFLLR
ncbi:RNA polymerase sigma factor [Mucilaginibacter paludis]|uniref:RNA polymerase, sigma-24 subunit, ECF subfamily n=1 Tax=Mucilaginibacter paludis DSM 18603 TaxID=714943 RepID=H1Y893_9SPHI|nr:RNA polymerase sigma-70 factor [Mucilaginibacter paludis]EHQ24912.1 RNA polymerase, sigma-24 subunit, ECF subfamily [Mucilaginibacter paludis DSM 18603]